MNLSDLPLLCDPNADYVTGNVNAWAASVNNARDSAMLLAFVCGWSVFQHAGFEDHLIRYEDGVFHIEIIKRGNERGKTTEQVVRG